MRAFIVEKYAKDGLRAADVPDPIVGPRDVLVRVSAASINPLDTMTRNGEFKRLIKRKPPFVLGHDLAGVITEVGAEVRAFTVGDQVYARPRDQRIGTFAELIAIDQDDLAPKPTSLTLQEAAAVPLVALAAWQILVDRARLQPGQKVLVHAGAGGLGSTVIQLAKHLGAVVATTASTATVDLVSGLGADAVIDYKQQDFSQILSGCDLVIDSLGGQNLAKSLTVLRPGGLAIGVAGPPDAQFARQLGAPALLGLVMTQLSRKVRNQAKALGVTYEFFFMQANGSQLRQLAALYDAGVLRPVIDTTFPFDQTPEAMAYVEKGRTTAGKVLVTMQSHPEAEPSTSCRHAIAATRTLPPRSGRYLGTPGPGLVAGSGCARCPLGSEAVPLPVASPGSGCPGRDLRVGPRLRPRGRGFDPSGLPVRRLCVARAATWDLRR